MAASPGVQRLARGASAATGIPANVILGLIDVESGGNINAVSPAGAFGLTQFMPPTARSYGVKRGNARSQVYGAARYLKALGYQKNPRLALKSYNAGPGNPGAAGNYDSKVLGAAKRYKGANKGVAAGGGGGASLVPGVPGSGGTMAQPQLGSAAGADALVKALEPPPAPPLGAIPAPRVMAGPVFPTVGGAPVPAAPSFGSPPPLPDVQDQIRAAAALRREAPVQAQSDAGVPGLVIPGAEGGGGLAAGGKRGKVSISANADRPGVHTNKRVIEFAQQVAGIAHVPLTLGTGTRHNRLTVNGRVSDHWAGNAGDFPATGKTLRRMGHAALIAAGMDPAEAKRVKGGLFNIGRYQIIFATNEGGNHFTHLHIGVR